MERLLLIVPNSEKSRLSIKIFKVDQTTGGWNIDFLDRNP